VPRLATIDLGTNTVRLLVAEAEGSGWRALLERQEVTRLGEGQAAHGQLGTEPMRRTADVVEAYVAAARRLAAASVRIVATSAVREAPNGAAFAARLATATGCAVEIISGADEARLTLLAVRRSLPALAEPFACFDIGGGSTELTLGRGDRVLAWVSLTLGVVALTERFTGKGPVRPERYAALRRHVDERLRREVPDAIAGGGARALVGTAGTVTSLAALDLGLAAYDGDRVHGHRLTKTAVDALLARLGPMTIEQRAQLPCLEPGRADVIIPGIAICLGALDRLGFDSFTVSDRGLREGILWDSLLSP
jgi:exopolyphosphatase/guanosine-5'-triphosphate,3'-diphosphate pyrophosphatase